MCNKYIRDFNTFWVWVYKLYLAKKKAKNVGLDKFKNPVYIFNIELR